MYRFQFSSQTLSWVSLSVCVCVCVERKTLSLSYGSHLRAMADQGISTPSVIGLVTIFCCIYGGQFVNAAGPSTTRYVITNGNVILNPGIPGGVLQEILWKHGVNKAVEWSTDRIQEFRDFKGRTSLNTTTGEITIRQLTMQLSGVYEAECVIGKKIQTFQQRVEVIDPVSQPDGHL
ncbi:unnamed protein product [Oncorhynchus mykiss]|uniref:Immunoglobulin V-set domain-containing protein n=1 Tax=Oncorhynchus mykiss TaxID=8022 RepID=A0A060XGR8_ONCMY|nr:unnamed protein product [Oncorhynchus mykiss]